MEYGWWCLHLYEQLKPLALHQHSGCRTVQLAVPNYDGCANYRLHPISKQIIERWPILV